MKIFWIVAALGLAALLVSQPGPERMQPGPDAAGGYMLVTGWRIQPAGKQIPLDTFPMSSALSKPLGMATGLPLSSVTMSPPSPLRGFGGRGGFLTALGATLPAGLGAAVLAVFFGGVGRFVITSIID